MGFFDRKIKQLEQEESSATSTNLMQATSDKAVDVIKQLSGKSNNIGKKIIDNVIVFSNTAGGAGASTIANNFAYKAVEKGLSVLMIDLNIMCPVQHTYLGIDQTLEKDDLVSFLIGGISLNQCIDTSQKVHLLFANNRTLTDEINCETKASIDNLNMMIGTLRNYYDVVVVDCPMRIDSLLYNTMLYNADAMYIVWDEGIGSIINTEKIRRNMALSGIDSYTKMRIILNKRTSVHFSDYSLKKLNLELVGVLPFSIDIIDNSLRGRIFCDKGVASGKNGAEFARKMEVISNKILKIGGYVE